MSVQAAGRRRRPLSLLVAVVMLLALVVAATRADGRDASRAETNDGGAWLLKRDSGVVGHVNRSALEVSNAVRVSDPRSDFDVDQADGVIIVHDRSVGTVSIVDDRSNLVVNSFSVPEGVEARAIDRGAVISSAGGGTVWILGAAQLREIKDVNDIPPVQAPDITDFDEDPRDFISSPNSIAITLAGQVAAHDPEARTIRWLDPSGAFSEVAGLPATGATRLTVADNRVVAVAESGLVVVATDDRFETFDVRGETIAAIQQPSAQGRTIFLVTQSGAVEEIDLEDGRRWTVATVDAVDPVSPIVHQGCVFAVHREPATFTKICNGEVVQTERLAGAGPSLRLRLVNGWVWINDVTTGLAWVADASTDVEPISDWGATLPRDADDVEDPVEGAGGIEELRDNPNAEEIGDSQEFDPDEENEPPTAADDATQTRVDRQVVVDVLANDSDPNGDVLMVASVTSDAGASAQIAPTFSRDAVQVNPAAGFEGRVSFTYTISDGRGGTATATATVDITPLDGDANRPPVAVTDNAAAAVGRSASLNVIDNDWDPDGDLLVLIDANAESGAVSFDPDGTLVYTPDVGLGAGTVEVNYVISDDFGELADGTVRVRVRLGDANNEPHAFNDAASTVVDRPVVLDLLANDRDPDNDALFISQRPQPVTPAAELATTRITSDGEFFFNSSEAGTHVFFYAASDGEESDVAVIRVEVEPAGPNRQPVAVRDDVVIPAGSSRIAYVLDNDGDPDGDVVAIVDFVRSEHLRIELYDDVGFRIGATPDAPPRVLFRYAISDGRSDPVWAAVVVAVTDVLAVNQPPVARPDLLSMRSGRTSTIGVLANDFDPEGGPLQVVSVGEVPEGASVEIGPNGESVRVTLSATVASGFTIGYDVADEAGNRTASTIRVSIVRPEDPNRPPIARTDIARTLEEMAVAVPVLTNDSDPDGDPIAIESIATQPSGGSASLDPGAGTIRYSPAAGFTGTDRFTYVLIDSAGAREFGEVLVGVMPLPPTNRPPVPVDDEFTVTAGDTAIPLDVLANDVDPDGDQLIISETSGVQLGELSVTDDRSIVIYTPPEELDVTTEIALTYAVDDGHGHRADATVLITVERFSQPIAPIAVDDAAGPIAAGDSISVNVLANDSDPDGTIRGLVVSLPGGEGTVDGGLVRLTAPDESTQIEYVITDPTGLSDSAIISLLVVENRAPELAPLQVETTFETPISLTLGSQATDPDGDTLYFVCCSSESHGGVTIVTSEANVLDVLFTPDDGFSGEATFAYSVDDQNGHAVSGSVTITVLPPENVAPVAIDGHVDIEAGTTANVDLTAFVTDDDIDDTITYTSADVTGPIVTKTGSGPTIQLQADIIGAGATDSFTFTATDSFGEQATGTVTITVTDVQDPPPLAGADQAQTNQEVAVDIDVLLNDTDPVGLGLTIIQVGVSPDGTTEDLGNGTVRFTPALDFFGTATFTYTIEDATQDPARNAVGQVQVDVIGRPAQPLAPTVTDDSMQATLTWTSPANNGGPITHYVVEHDQGGLEQPGLVNSYLWAGLTNGVEYRFRVTAVNQAGSSVPSEWSQPVIPDEVPGQPSAPTVIADDEALLVSWVEPPNAGTAITTYELRIGGGTSDIRPIADTTYPWDTLTNGTQYTFEVRAINDKGPGEWSTASLPAYPYRQPDVVMPAPVLTRGNQALDITWTKPADNGDPIIQYEIEMENGPVVQVIGENTLNYTWGQLVNGVEQRFRVRAINQDPDLPAFSDWSNSEKPCTVPDAPGAPNVTRGDTQIDVTWTTPDSQGCDITSYEIRANGSIIQNAGAGAVSHTFDGLTNGNSYQFEVRAINEEGPGAWSPVSAAIVPAGPPFTSTLSTPIVACVGGTPTIDLSWTVPGDNGTPITHYLVSTNGGAGVNVGNVTTYAVPSVGTSQTYSFTVQAVNDVGAGPVSGSVTSAQTCGTPSQVTGLALTAGNARIDASWNAPSANGNAITHYVADLIPGASWQTGATSYAFTGLSNGTSYDVRIQACNEVGCGPWSTTRSATPVAPRVVTLSKGSSAGAEPGCTSGNCEYLNVTATGFATNTNYTVLCQEQDGSWATFWTTSETTNGSGTFSGNLVCFYGFNLNVRVSFGGTLSNVIAW